jgi:hypothetical protein
MWTHNVLWFSRSQLLQRSFGTMDTIPTRAYANALLGYGARKAKAHIVHEFLLREELHLL